MVQRALALIDYNFVIVYNAYVGHFQRDCTMRQLWNHLKRQRYQWLPTYEWFTVRWMPTVRKQMEITAHRRAVGRID